MPPPRTKPPAPTPAGAAPPVLVVDLGGTNTRVALADGPHLRPGSIRRYRNADHSGLAPILVAYLRDTGDEICAAACLSVAGPVRGDRARMTNLDWDIDAPGLAAELGLTRVALLNDLQAQGHALGHLAPRSLVTLLPGSAAPPAASRLVVGAGTGFNAAPVHYTAAGPVVPPSECGHVHLPRHGATEESLARHLAERHGIATVEEALCGRGLEALHSWVTGAGHPADVIVQRIAAGEAGALRTGQLYARLMGRTLASLALIHLPYGGIYLIGGVARAMAPHLSALGMAETFAEMGRFSEMMQNFAVMAVRDDYAALTGCAAYLGRAAVE